MYEHLDLNYDCWFPANIWSTEDVAKGLADVGVAVLAGGCCVHQT